jgi:hypothetical protein
MDLHLNISTSALQHDSIFIHLQVVAFQQLMYLPLPNALPIHQAQMDGQTL